MLDSWFVYALISSGFLSCFFLINQYFKVSGKSIVFWSRLFCFLALLPFFLNGMFTLPDSSLFYLLCFSVGLLATYGDIKFLNLSVKYGGGLVSRLSPVLVLISFSIWVVIDPNSILKYQDQPIIILSIFIALMGCLFFSLKLNKCNITKSAFLSLLPALIALAITGPLNKHAMDISDLNSGVFSYILLQSIFMVFVLLVSDMVSSKKEIFNVKIFDFNNLKIGFLMMIILAGIGISKNYSMSFTDNPGYVNAVMLLSPIWISIFYKAIKHKEESDVKSAMGIVFSVMILILATSN